MGMSYEHQRHIEAYKAAGNTKAEEFIAAQQSAWKTFMEATGTQELPLEKSHRAPFVFIIAGKEPGEKYKIIYSMLSNPEYTRRVLTCLFIPYVDLDPGNPAKRTVNALKRHAVTHDEAGNEVPVMSTLDILRMTKEELLGVRNFGEKCLSAFMEVSQPLRESLDRSGLLP